MDKFLIEKFYIPNYQREYSWENEELEDFWNDLESTRSGLEETHFFGQVVVHDDHDDSKKKIIDGQQRTTTSIIFLRAMQLVFLELYNSSDKNSARYKSEDIELKYLGREEERHLTLGEMDNEFFEKYILSAKPDPNPKSKAKRKSQERLRKAYVFFDEKIREFIKESENDDDKIDELIGLYSAFIQRFKVLYMEATELDEAFVIFETLNARGRDLETADLLKNYILSQSSKDVKNSLKTWNSMINKLDKCDTTKYIRNFWNATHSFTREKALYRAINKVTSPKDVKELLKDLDALAESYHNMVYPSEMNCPAEKDPSCKALKSSLVSLKMLKASTFYPVILAMKKQGTYTYADLLKVIKIVECYVVRNFTICKKTANSTETYFANIAKDIYDENLTSVEDICAEIRKVIVPDEEFRESFAIWTGSKSSKETIRYLLRSIHNHLAPSTELQLKDDNTEVHIEHIMPEDNTKWNMDDEIYETYLWRLGNLCLLGHSINQSISNDIFAEKRQRYLESNIEPNKAIAENETWDAEAIEKRQKKLAEYALEIWKK